jgi:hypothetical protein
MGALVSQMGAHQAKTETNHELTAATKASQESVEALMDASLEVMEACLD